MKVVEEEKSGAIEPKELLASLAQCHESCIDGVRHSLSEGGDFVEHDHIKVMLDCADICKTTEDFVIRESEYAGDLLSLCAIVCEDCAESCSKFFNDKHMLACSEVCRNCADACRNEIAEEEEALGKAEELH